MTVKEGRVEKVDEIINWHLGPVWREVGRNKVEKFGWEQIE